MADPGSGTCTFMFKKRNVKGRATRKRNDSSEEEQKSTADTSSPLKAPKRKRKANLNIQSTSKQAKAIGEEKSSNSDSSSNDESFGVNYKSSKSVMSTGPKDQGATATLEIETEKDRDAQAIFEKKLEINKQLEGQADDKIYRGINNYAQYYKPKDTAAGNASSGLVRRGPIRAPANLRATVRWDYQPDICKDYKETGFCGFGDSCKFLHDRSDYKHGWQLEQEWEAGEYGKDDEDDKKYEIDSDSDLFPDECGICKGPFDRPVATKCKHYFCEECAIVQYKKSMRCAICNTQTNGIFNPAKDLINHLKKAAKKKGSSSESDSD